MSAVRRLARAAASPAPSRRGLTMLELLLVLALLVAVGAATMPAFFGPLENYRLRKAGDTVRVHWEKLRIEAMKSGQTMMFRFQVGANRCQGGPWSTGEDLLETSSWSFSTPVANMAPTAPLPATGFQFEDQLPERVVFVGVESAVSMRDAAVQQAAAAMMGPNLAPEDQAWSPPILFYPDGSTSTVRLLLQNERQQFIMLKLRGLTGVTEVSDLLTSEELPP